MATAAYHIRSNYNPEEDRKRLEIETGQLEEDVIAETTIQEREEDPWLTEKPFGTSVRVLRPPRFVPATIDYNEWGSESKSLNLIPEKQEKEDESTESVSGWYRSLTSKTPGGTPRTNTPAPKPQTPPLKGEEAPSSLPKNAVKKDRNNWFIARALEASASSSAGTTSSPGASSGASSSAPTPSRTPTLADILARDPPPLPTEEKYLPPVWLAIGPGNKGFDMMQRKGWEEGETLGKFSRNRSGLGYRRKEEEKAVEEGENMAHVKKEVIDITSVDREIVDLTLSDDDDDDSEGVFSHRLRSPPVNVPSVAREEHETPHADLDHAPRALLTPLPTVLKSDRLGIGLKAKTTGSGIYRAPIKRITHSQAALEAHARESEERRRLKKLVGRGRRGFEKVDKREQEKRKALIAYLNT